MTVSHFAYPKNKMFKKVSAFLMILIFLGLTGMLLRFPDKALVYALSALDLWYEKMIPALLPFMILSGILLRMDLARPLASFFRPIFGPFFRLNDSCLFVIVFGFLCGFPMGARLCADMLRQKMLTKKQAQFLLSFCNNIGPVYIIGYAAPLLHISNTAYLLTGIYGIPFLYGIFNRYTFYRSLNSEASVLYKKSQNALSFLSAFNQSVLASLDSITALGGYMIFCSVLKLIPSVFLKNPLFLEICTGLLEIGNGISQMKLTPEWLIWGLLTFGGLSCIAQTCSCIQDTGLSVRKYVFDKIIQAILVSLWFYLPVLLQ